MQRPIVFKKKTKQTTVLKQFLTPVLNKIKKKEKQHVGRLLTNNGMNFIQNEKYCNLHTVSLRQHHLLPLLFHSKSLNGEVDTTCLSNKAQTQQLPLSPWLACKLTLGGSPVITKPVWTWASHP